MYFADQVRRKGIQIGAGLEAHVVGADVNIVDVQQQTAAGALDQLGEKVDLTEVVSLQMHVVAGVLDG
ncbi:hypothetical protein D3C84_998580 [compost metagenome]